MLLQGKGSALGLYATSKMYELIEGFTATKCDVVVEAYLFYYRDVSKTLFAFA